MDKLSPDYIPEPTNIFNKIYILLKERGKDYTFQSHEEIRLAIGERFPDEPMPKQPAISKAMKQIAKEVFAFKEGKFVYIEKPNGYGFYDQIWEFVTLFEEHFQFQKNTVFRMSYNTLVFHLSELDADRFAEKVKATFPSELFWGISVQGEYVYLMFANKKIDGIDYFNYFRELVPEYMRYLLIVGHNSRSARQKRNARNHLQETRTDTDDAR